MIDLNELRKNPQVYQRACDRKRIKFDISAFLALDDRLRSLKQSVEQRRAEQNSFSKQIKSLAGAEKEAKLASMKQLASELKEGEAQLAAMEAEWRAQLLQIPGIPLDRVPDGKDDSENREIRRWGEVREFDFEPLDHVELGKRLGILDIERGVKVAGARSYFLIGDGARLQHALLAAAIDHLHARGYLLMEPPHIVKWEAMMGTGYFPGGEEMAYHLDERDRDFHLIGTAEVPVASFHLDEILDRSELPKRYAGYSPCYRREAGAYGKDTRGIYRIHQFYKVEQVVICEASAEASDALHAELLGNAESLLQLLELPYRVVDVCTGDMGQGQIYKNDIECWMPSRKAYGETHSCSSFYDFQARRLNLRYRDGEKKQFCYTLNNTCVASPRILISILELNQNRDGTVNIPKLLQPYMGGQTVIKPRENGVA